MALNLSRSKKQQLHSITKYVAIIAAILMIWFVYDSRQSNSLSSSENVLGSTAEVAPPVATADINQSFPIPLTDENGDELADLDYAIENAELRKEILVKGNKATAIEGRAFLVVNLKITNNSEKGVNVNSRNYIRLNVNDNQEEWFAPDIHNDPVEVQAISTKKTRIGFPINETDTNLTLQFGDIEGEKIQIPVQFN